MIIIRSQGDIRRWIRDELGPGVSNRKIRCAAFRILIEANSLGLQYGENWSLLFPRGEAAWVAWMKEYLSGGRVSLAPYKGEADEQGLVTRAHFAEVRRI